MIRIKPSNQQALEVYAPDLLAQLADVDAREAQRDMCYLYSACHAKDGQLIDMLSDGNKTIYLQSQYRPLDEARRFAKQYEDAKDSSCFLFLGMGNGYIIRELMQREKVTFIFYEPSVSYFMYILENYDIADIFKAKNVHIFVKGLNDSSMLLEMYVYITQWNWHSVYLESMPKYQQLYPDILTFLAKLREDGIWHAQQNYINKLRMSDANMRNAVCNLQYIYSGDSICRFEGMLPEDTPVIVVAGGPSLEKNVEQLKKCRNQAFILAVDRVAGFLAKHDIVPHAYVTVDAEKPVDLFDAEGIDAVPWFLCTTANHQAVQKISQARLIFCSTIYSYAKDLFQICGSDLPSLDNGGSVATVAVSIGMYLGSRRIILIGQDLALSERKIHAGGKDVDLSAGEDELLEVPGFYGSPVYTQVHLKSYIDFYRAYVQYHSEITFINATEGGAYLQGMEHMSLADAMTAYGNAHIDGDRLMNAVPPLMEPKQQVKLADAYHSLFSYMKRVKRMCPSAITDVERGIRLLEQYGFGHSELGRVEGTMGEFQTLYESHAGRSIIDLGIAQAEQEALQDINFMREDPTEEMLRLYKKMLDYYKGIESAVAKTVPMLEEVLHKIV